MRFTWMIIALIVVWLAATLLVVVNQAPNAELFFGGAIMATIILACVGFLTS